MPSRIVHQALLAAAAAAACLAVAGCESSGGKVSALAGQTPIADSSYAWAPDAQAGSGDPRVDNDIIRGGIRTAVDTNLAAKGYRHQDPAGRRAATGGIGWPGVIRPTDQASWRAP